MISEDEFRQRHPIIAKFAEKLDEKGMKVVYDENYYKDLYFKEYNKNVKCLAFIEMLESQTSDWDDMCDCSSDFELHDKDCRTMNIRKDLENLRNLK